MKTAQVARPLTLRTKVSSSFRLWNRFQPSRFNALETALALYEIFSTHVYRSVAVAKHDTAPPAEEDDAYQEEQEEEEERRKHDKQGEDDVERVPRAIGDLWRAILLLCNDGRGLLVLDGLDTR